MYQLITTIIKLRKLCNFSLERNSLIISKNVVYSNQKNLLVADVIEINIMTKDAKIFMYEKKKRVNIKSN